MEKVTFSMQASASKPSDVLFKVILDDQIKYEGSLDTNVSKIMFDFDDSDDKQHQIIFEMSGKTLDHTTISEDGAIIDDIVFNLKEIHFDGINCDQLFSNLAVYEHDFNGTGDMSKEKFFWTIGCNGRVTLDFSTPIYLWLLENI